MIDRVTIAPNANPDDGTNNGDNTTGGDGDSGNNDGDSGDNTSTCDNELNCWLEDQVIPSHPGL